MDDVPVPPSPILPPPEFVPPPMPTKRQQSWGALLSIVVIMLMIIVGAFYAWGKRIADERQLQGAVDAAFDTATTTP